MQVHHILHDALVEAVQIRIATARQGEDIQPVHATQGGNNAVDQVEISPQGQLLATALDKGGDSGASNSDGDESVDVNEPSALNPQQVLSEEEQQEIEALKDRDREVRTHEQAHKAAAGAYARGGPSYTYQKGPDGKRYAVGGEVQIDTSPVPDDPQATIRKAQVIRRAASAPAEPSAQDRRVTAEASRMKAEAQQELSKQQREEADDGVAAGEREALEAAGSIEQGGGTVVAANAFGRFDGGTSQGTGQLLDVLA